MTIVSLSSLRQRWSNLRMPPILTSSEVDVFLISSAVKLLLIPTYRSTDFEVHRNWLAITYSLPISKWYYDETSPWTLDYPPFFGYFEYALSRIASLIDRKIVQIDNLGYEAWTCVVFQRLSVIVTELIFGAALLKLTRNRSDQHASLVAATSLFLHPGLIIVDHIHFQYNGFLLGIFLWSIWAMKQRRFCLSAFIFTSLLNFKHIFLYLSPPFLIYLFRVHCIKNVGVNDKNGKMTNFKTSVLNLIELGSIVIGTCLVAFGPFYISSGLDGIIQIIGRLFPFQRGLNHAYWAGNLWALYTALDRVLLKYQIYRGITFDPSVLHSTSRGLVGDATFAVLPAITPKICLGLTLGFLLIIMTKLWQDPTYSRFLKSLILSALTSFLFGWHVHEKAALLFLVPLTLVAVEDYYHYRTWLIASLAGISGLFPLLIRKAETPIKLIYTFIWIECCARLLKRNLHRPSVSNFSILITRVENAYMVGLILLHFYLSIIHEAINVDPKTKFLPLMMISLYTAIGIFWSFLRLFFRFLFF